ncbi:MAG TPA: alpha/beta fold hydrolase [Spirochaetota bacterium]|nr:alpha/beta fold hydrolase [Spirochaetota bacterium]HRZ27220.1 alpha/beta fold hydrolase [Spirochaetota bacterium]HSA16407.1 alpha/beta fold hydrolase [Spirochaetota bacterium]
MNEPSLLERRQERIADITAEISMIKTADGAALALTRIPTKQGANPAGPVILLHGNYSKRNFWISPGGVGLARFLSESGWDAWIPELRGHGLSPKTQAYAKITAEDQIRHDLPAIQDYVMSATGRKPFWIAHSFGGVYLYFSLAAGWIPPDGIRGMAVLGSQFTEGEKYLKVPPLEWICRGILRAIGHFPAPRFGMGPEPEPAATMIEIIKWKSLFGSPVNSEGFDYRRGFPRITAPILALAGAADDNDPPKGCRFAVDLAGSADKRFIVLGRAEGFSKDYDHTGMIIAKEARIEVWPLIEGWMRERTKA